MASYGNPIDSALWKIHNNGMRDLSNLRDLREKTLKLSQAELAEKLSVDQSTVSAWEKGGLPKRPLLRGIIEARINELVALAEKAA